MSNWEPRYWDKVDKTDDCWLWTASRCADGYGRFGMHGGSTRAHRLGYVLAHGPIPDGMEVDHTCHVRHCVKPSHLRAVTHKQNLENYRGAYRNSQSGIRGVRWHKQTSKWEARIQHHGKAFNLGLFETVEEAESAVITKRLELFTHNEVDRAAARA